MTNRRGAVVSKLRLTDRVKPRMLFMTLHFEDSVSNLLANPARDPISKAPEYEVFTVRRDRIGRVKGFTNKKRHREVNYGKEVRPIEKVA